MLQNSTSLAILAFALGLGLIFILHVVVWALRQWQARSESERLIAEAKEDAKLLEDERKTAADIAAKNILDRAETEIERQEERLAKLERRVRDNEIRLEAKLDPILKQIEQKESELQEENQRLQQVEKRAESRKQVLRAFTEDYLRRLESKSSDKPEALKEELKSTYLAQAKIEATRLVQEAEENMQAVVGEEARKVLTLAINRFARPYCAERGIGYIHIENPDVKARVLGPNESNLRLVEKLVGVDIAFDVDHSSVNVYGFDPVRRELGRAVIERMVSERNLNPKRVEEVCDKVKRDLFRKIANDGDRIARELRMEGLHKNIKNMMGALRYRYSFTQNQYFHCGEVGFLCGLLAAELDVPIKDARRAGLLHDIGKAMDHSTEGGHAVIGADFIMQNGETEHIVHAVRAHHFDEQPNSNLAYLVIAADAISGARPGARRSTAVSYTQKIQDLQTIANGYSGIIDTHVLSAGRELRVYVDGQRINDHEALVLSKQIAEKIEADMSYPGQIKVTVVRETQAVEYAR